MSYRYELGFAMPAGYEIVPVSDPRYATSANWQYKGATPAQQRVMEQQYTETLNNALAAEQATLVSRFYYPSQFAKLAAAGVRAANKQGFNSRTLGQQFGFVFIDKEYGYSLWFPDKADYDKARSVAGEGFGSRPHGDANWWIMNTDIGVLQAAGAPFTITTQGRVFSKLLLHEYELWKELYDGLTVHIQQKYKVDPNQFADPNISLPNAMPTPATPEAVVATPAAPPAPAPELPPITLPYAEAVKTAAAPAAPVTYYSPTSTPFDVPALAPVAAPAPAASAAPAVLGVGALLWLLLRK